MNRENSNKCAEIFHLFHSAAAVRYKNKLFVFDYYLDQAADLENDSQEFSGESMELGVIREDSFRGIDKAYIFVSHSHHDHYNKVIFDWNNFAECSYIMAEEVELDAVYRDWDNIYQLSKDEELEIDSLQINTYGSTDQGVSFLIKFGGLSVFHSGDLNWWKWKKFSPRVQKREEREYKREIKKIEDEKIDIAFVPVDPRLEENYYLAGKYFIEKLRPKLFIPLHFADNFEITAEFSRKYSTEYSRAAEISRRGEKLIYML